MTRIDDTPVHKAIREGMINMLIHSDYMITGVFMEHTMSLLINSEDLLLIQLLPQLDLIFLLRE